MSEPYPNETLLSEKAAHPAGGDTAIRPFWRDGLALLLLLTLFLLSAALFLLPWLPPAPPGGDALARYMPMQDGDAWLSVTYDSEGNVKYWESGNRRRLQSGRALAADLRAGARDLLEQFYRAPGEEELSESELLARLAQVQLFEEQIRQIDPGGRITDTITLTLREPRGIYLLGFHEPERENDLLFVPPAPILPSTLEVGHSWSEEGRLAGVLDYQAGGRVVATGPLESELGSFEDCLQLEEEVLLFGDDGERVHEEHVRSWYCAGIGAVESQSYDAEGKLTTRRLTLTTSRPVGRPSPLPPSATFTPSELPPGSDPDSWTLSRLGRLGRTIMAHESTISPLWLPTSPPLLLAAGFDGELVALDTSEEVGRTVWRFRPGGVIYGTPGVDPETGRIYFGASDKKLYAIDARGMYLWSFQSGDNIASRPLIAGNTLIFGSEDRSIYGLDPATGELKWELETEGPVVSSPALAGELVVIGSDDGQLYALAPSNGELKWKFPTNEAIEAPIVAAEGVVYAASRDERLYAIEGATGELIWSTEIGEKLRTAPLVTADRLFLVDEAGRVTAIDRQSGRWLWQSTEEHYVGPPVLLDDTLLLSGNDGAIYRLDLAGQLLGQWPETSGREVEGPASFKFAPALGGGAAWLADDSARLWRLGAPVSGAEPLALNWAVTAYEPPFNSYLFASSAVNYRNNVLLVDGGNHLYLVDPSNGKSVRLGEIAGAAGTLIVEPVVAGDTLLTVHANMLHATHLPDGKPLWQVSGGESTTHPVRVVGETIFWLSQHGSEVGNISGVLQAIDLVTGERKWELPLESFQLIGGVQLHGDRLYLGTPPTALDAATGEVHWQRELDGQGIGGPALDESGETLYIGLLGQGAASGEIAALNAQDGRERWRTTLDQQALYFAERPLVVGEQLIIPGLEGAIIALDRSTGTERWRYEAPLPRLGNVTLADNHLWFMLVDGQLLALDVESGEPTLQFRDLEQNLEGIGLMQRPLVLGNQIIAPLGGALLGLESER